MAEDQIAGFSTGSIGSVVERVPKIPNTLYDPPLVSIKQCRKVSYMEDLDGFEGWFEVRGDIRAEIREYTDKERAFAAKCGRVVEEGTYTRETSFTRVPTGSVIVWEGRNPWLKIPAGCELADDGVNLVEA